MSTIMCNTMLSTHVDPVGNHSTLLHRWVYFVDQKEANNVPAEERNSRPLSEQGPYALGHELDAL